MDQQECQGCGSQINQQNLINLRKKKEFKMPDRVIVHRQTCSKGTGWNILDLSLNKLDWTDYGILTDCYFYVSQTGRKHMIDTKERFLHAWIVCEFEKAESMSVNGLRKINYNPYVNTTFVYDGTGECLFRSKEIVLTPQGAFQSKP